VPAGEQSVDAMKPFHRLVEHERARTVHERYSVLAADLNRLGGYRSRADPAVQPHARDAPIHRLTRPQFRPRQLRRTFR